MKISIIIPCYNAQNYLPACLDTLIAQTMDDYEVIMIDDGSVDNTAAIAEAYTKKDERFSLIRQENAGVSAARNVGLEAACGEWVLFVDADDLVPAEALEHLLSCVQDDTDIVVSLHETFGENTDNRVEYPQTQWMNLQGEEKKHAAALRLIEGDAVLNVMCNKLHRRSFLERERIRLQKGIRIAEDALFNLEAVLCAREIAFCEKLTYQYRIHAASATQTRAKSEFDTHLPWFIAMASMLERRGMLERYYRAYFASVVLRLYKDGGVAGVMRDFTERARPLLMIEIDEAKLDYRGKLLRFLGKNYLYPFAYPVIYPFEVANRKVHEAMFRLRLRRIQRGKGKSQRNCSLLSKWENR